MSVLFNTTTGLAAGEYLRPALILLCAMLVFNLPIVLYKLRLLVNTILYLLFCNDKSWKKPMDPNSIFGPHIAAGKVVERKTVYFVRHGESTWNDTFNKGHHRSTVEFILGFLPGLIKAVLFEIYLVLSGKMDSWFYDSPLSYVGLKQVEDLAVFLEGEQQQKQQQKQQQQQRDDLDLALRILRADPGAPGSTFVSSNLRRAISTLAGGFRARFKRRQADRILVLPSLQEISRNPDALCISPAQTPIHASWIEKQSPICDFEEILASHVDVSRHTGNKTLTGTGYVRMTDFCKTIFSSAVREKHVIVGGHSLWFKCFFRDFLPASVDHVAKKKKIVNGGIVAFDLLKAQTQYGEKYMIDPQTVRVIYLGF